MLDRRPPVCFVALTLLLSCLAGPLSGQIRLGQKKELFLDDHLIAARENVRRVVHPVTKHPQNPVLRPTEPWEGSVAIVFGSVLRDEGKYRMWYLGHTKDGARGVAYAESLDGIAWQKPVFDFHRVDGQRTNLLIPAGAKEGGPNALPTYYELFGVHKDPAEADPSRRYKLGFLSIERGYRGPREDPFHRGQRRGLGVAASPDGIHWRLMDSWATEAICDGATHWMYDPARAKYVLYGRTKHMPADVLEAWKGNEWARRHFWGRAVARVESDDFLRWSHVDPGSGTLVMAPDVKDPPGTEIYSMNVFPYETVYIGLVQVFHNQPDTCHLDIQLAVSRDSIHFERVGDRSPFLPVGDVGTWDRFNQSLANNPPLVSGDELRFYYGGRTSRHSPYAGKDTGEPFGGIGLGTIRRDRFVSLQASFDGGTILTRPLQLQGKDLYLNAKSDFGSIVIEALGRDGQTLARSEPLRADQLRIPVSWSSGSLDGSAPPIQLRVTLKNAQLFAIWCE